MAFTNNITNIEVTAKLTPYGRQQLLSSSSGDLIKKFTLGDSDANYFTSESLDFGEVPNSSGSLGFDNTQLNSVHSLVDIKSKIFYNSKGGFYKPVPSDSNKVLSTLKFSDVNTYITSITDYKLISKDDFNSSDINLLSSIYQPITETQKFNFSGVTFSNGGYLNTALEYFNADEILLVNLSGSTYGELINGRNISVSISTSGGTYDLFSTFQRTNLSNNVQDTNYRESSTNSKSIGENIVYLFSDQIQRPNSDISKTWSKGFNTLKPFSSKGKEYFNYIDNTSLNQVRDKMVGYVLLDKGFLVLTNPTIISDFNINSDLITITYGSVSTEVSQEIVCIVERGEFNVSSNPTYSDGENIRVSEIGLYDDNSNLIAIGKINKQLQLGANQFMAISVKITV